MAAMHSLVDLDVTRARNLVARSAEPVSFTAFVVASVARVAAAHPQVHAYRNGRGRLVRHRHVDVNTLVEVTTRQGLMPLQVVIGGATQRPRVVDGRIEVRDVLDLTTHDRYS
jgi:pyruvate/2-oxoglutarate dehydrogenase complex dihydrolipoamide acyltransferase (E2) component